MTTAPGPTPPTGATGPIVSSGPTGPGVVDPLPSGAPTSDLGPGWYPDPARGSDAFRWWTGAGWTAWLASDPDAAAPPDAADPHAGPVVPPRVSRGLSAPARVGIVAAVVVVLVAAMVVAGYPNRSQVVFTQPLPSVTASPADLSLRCEDDRFAIGDAVGVRPTDRYATGGPFDTFALRNDQCIGRATGGELPGNLIYTFGVPPDDLASLPSDQLAEQLADAIGAALYTAGPVQIADRRSAPLTGIADATGHTVTGRFTNDKGLSDAFEVTVIEIDGARGVWFHVLGAKLGAEDRDAVLAVRATLGRPSA